MEYDVHREQSRNMAKMQALKSEVDQGKKEIAM